MHQVLARLRLARDTHAVSGHRQRGTTSGTPLPNFLKNKIVTADTRIFRQCVPAAAGT